MRAKKLSTLIILLFTAAFAHAATRLVPAQYPNIQSAIDDCNDGDTVIVAPGTYTGPGNRDIDFRGKAITVQSIDPNNPAVVARTIIDCNGTPDNYHRGFNFHAGEDANSILAGFTITNGYADFGGAIRCAGEPRTDLLGPTILNCVITSNSAVISGGAVSISYNRPTISNCTISANKCLGDSRERSGGGGIDCYVGSPTVSNCRISANQCLGAGDGQSNGGGIAYFYGSPTISNCTISDNSARNGAGGGIYSETANLVVTNCLVTRNSAQSAGGAIYNYEGNLSLANTTVTENSAHFQGGALACGYPGKVGKVTVNNSILHSNTAPSGPEIALNPDRPWYLLLNLAVSYSNVRGGLPKIYNPSDAAISWGPGNIDAEPYFNDPDNSDYHLKSNGWRWDAWLKDWTWDAVTSRCIDAGDPDAPLRDELVFAAVDPTGYWGRNLRVDMGAYGGTAEASIPPHRWAIRTDYNNDGIANFTDFAHWTKSHPYTAGEPLAPLNPSPALDPIDLGVFAADWLDQTSWPKAPMQASIPNPPDGSVAIRLDPVLSWEPGFGASSHDVYFGTSDPPTFRVSTTATTFTPGYLSKNTTYYWRIDEVNSFGKTTGPVWSFTTGTGGGGR